MTSKEALNELFVEANRCSNAPYKYTTYDLLQFCKQIQKDLEILELLHQRIKPDIFGRICYVPIFEERDGVIQDFEAGKIWEWIKNGK